MFFSTRPHLFQSAAGPASGGNLMPSEPTPPKRSCFNPPPDPRPAETLLRLVGLPPALVSIRRRTRVRRKLDDGRNDDSSIFVSIRRRTRVRRKHRWSGNYTVQARFQSAAGPASGGNITDLHRRRACLVSIRRRTRVRRKRQYQNQPLHQDVSIRRRTRVRRKLPERSTRLLRNCFNPPPDPRPAETSRTARTPSARRCFNPPPDPRPAETRLYSSPRHSGFLFQSAAGPASGGNRRHCRRSRSARCFNPPPDPRPAETCPKPVLPTPAGSFNPPPDPRPAETRWTLTQ